MVAIGLVYNSIYYDSTEEAIQKMIEASQKMINEQLNSRPVNEHFKLQIKTLQNAPRDPEKLERLLRLKQREKQEAMYMKDTQRLVTEKLKCSGLYFVFGDKQKKKRLSLFHHKRRK